jgi:ectoine hydroxylase-related dioxygenase (phytanoyl-CoA dioxygenase family)
MSLDWLSPFERDGYALFPDVVPPTVLAALTRAVERLGERLDLGVRGGLRNLFQELPEARTLAQHPALYEVVSAVLGPDCFAARAILFDKTPAANWKVVWHQDLSIAVRERREVVGFGPWSQKEGVLHVQPPAAVLERMVTLRLHLDDCGPANGPVRVLPGSHRGGRLSAADVARWRAEQAEVACVVGVGGVLLMRPLLLHASSPATAPAHRRVVHLEYAVGELPGGLAWAEL